MQIFGLLAVYFDQRYAFLTFLTILSFKKEKKARNLQQNLTKKFFFSLHQNAFQLKHLFTIENG